MIVVWGGMLKIDQRLLSCGFSLGGCLVVVVGLFVGANKLGGWGHVHWSMVWREWGSGVGMVVK